jgi:hypothetical protein
VSIVGFDSHLAYGGCVVFIIFNGGMVGGCGAVLRIGECRITLYELVSSYFFFFLLAGIHEGMRDNRRINVADGANARMFKIQIQDM